MKINFNNPFKKKQEKTLSQEEKVRLSEINKSIKDIEEKKLEEESNLEKNLSSLNADDKLAKMLEILKLQKDKADANYEKTNLERELRDGKNVETERQENEPEIKEPEIDLENIETKDRKKRTPEEEVEEDLLKYNLKDKMPVDFESLSVPKKMFVVEGIKKRIVDIVKAKAETQYSEYLKEKLGAKVEKKWLLAEIKEGVKKGGKSLALNLVKEAQIKDFEKEIFTSLISTPEGGKILKDNLEILTNNSKDEFITFSEDKSGTRIVYVDYGKGEYTEEEKEIIGNFNDVANKFRNLPYEWAHKDRKMLLSGDREKYEKIENQYDDLRIQLLNIKGSKEKPEERGKAMLEMSQITSKIKIDQLLNTHPEFEKQLSKFNEEVGFVDGLKTGANFINTITGKNNTNRFLMGIGYLARAVSKGVLAKGKMIDPILALSGMAIGGTLGYFKGKIKGKNLIQESKKGARHGKNKKELVKGVHVTDSSRLSLKLDNLVEKINQARTTTEKEEAMSLLMVSVLHTKGKIEKGEVNFGDSASILKNQLNLINSLNNAAALRETEFHDGELTKKLYKRLGFAGKGAEKESKKAQKEFIWKQAKRGIAMGVGFATVGYAIRWLGEHVGWWGPDGGKHLTEKVPEKIEIPETKEEIIVPPAQEEIKIPEEEIINTEEYVDVPENNSAVENSKIKKPIEKEPEDYETENGWNKITEEELKKQDTVEQIPKKEELKIEKNDNLEDDPTTKVQGSKIVWETGESGGEQKNVDLNTSRVQGSQIVWKTGESGSVQNNVDYETSRVQGSNIGGIKSTVPEENIPEENGEEPIEESTKEEVPKEEYQEPNMEEENKMGPPTEEEMDKYQEPKEKEGTLKEEESEEYREPISEEESKQAEISNEKEEYTEPEKEASKQPESDVENKAEYSEPEKDVSVSSENPHGLNETQLKEVKIINDENISKIFGEKMSTWENIKVLPAHEDIESVGLTEQKQSFIKYLKKLREESGLEPKVETLVSKAETNEEYIKRVFAEMAKRGQLEKLKL